MARRPQEPDLLTSDQRVAACHVSVWVVSWELPDKSWEAVCLSEATATTEYQSRKKDSLLSSWGDVRLHGPMTLEAWYDGHTQHHSSDAPTFVEVVQKLLASDADGPPVTVRTW